MLFRATYDPLLMALDLSSGTACERVWGPFPGQIIAGDLYWLIPAFALYLALRRTRPERRRFLPRITVGLLLIVGLLPALKTDTAVNGVIASDRETCTKVWQPTPAESESPVQAISRLPSRHRELAFLCGMRGNPIEPDPVGEPAPLPLPPRSYAPLVAPNWRELYDLNGPTPNTAEGAADVSERTDGFLLGVGRSWCAKGGPPLVRDAATGEGSLLRSVTVGHNLQEGNAALGGPYDSGWPAAAYLCPEVVARWNPGLTRSRRRIADERRSAEKRGAEYHARVTAACKPPRTEAGPRPKRQATLVLFTGEGGGYFLQDEPPGDADAVRDPRRGFQAAADDGLVAVDGDLAAVMSAENTAICVTVRAYAKAPPVSVTGWDQVTEVGMAAPYGRIRVLTWEGIPKLPVGSVTGPGRYRVRIHVRHDADAERTGADRPVEEHLLIVYPGESPDTKVLKAARL